MMTPERGYLRRPGSLAVLLTALVALAGCGGDDAQSPGAGVDGSAPVTGRSDAEYDPAMAAPPTQATREGREMAAQKERDYAESDPPAGLTVDVEGCRVFLPRTGWVGVARFWDIYYREPEVLPGTFDHEALRDIALEDADGEPGPGLACLGARWESGSAAAGQTADLPGDGE